MRSKEIAEKLVREQTVIQISDQQLKIRSLVSKAQRVLISNVQPCIPTALITQELEKLGVSPVSQITTVRMGTQHPSISHLLNFRKQMYLKPFFQSYQIIYVSLTITSTTTSTFRPINLPAFYVNKKAT